MYVECPACHGVGYTIVRTIDGRSLTRVCGPCTRTGLLHVINRPIME